MARADISWWRHHSGRVGRACDGELQHTTCSCAWSWVDVGRIIHAPRPRGKALRCSEGKLLLNTISFTQLYYLLYILSVLCLCLFSLTHTHTPFLCHSLYLSKSHTHTHTISLSYSHYLSRSYMSTVPQFKVACDRVGVLPYFAPAPGFMITPVYDIPESELKEICHRIRQALEIAAL